MRKPPAKLFPITSVLLLGGALLLPSCATMGGSASPAEVRRLETAVAQQPGHVASLTRLGAAYRSAGRLEDARETLERAERLQPGTGPVALYLGITYEQLGDLPRARRLYEAYLANGRSESMKRTIRQRMPTVQRLEMYVAIRDALAREAELSGTPDPATVAVFPFSVVTTDADLAPLGRAMAELLVTDLALTGRLRVLERTQVQLLLNEQQFGQTRYVDPGTAARNGRLLGAGRIVQGQLHGTPAQIALNAAVVNAATSEIGRLDRVRTEGPLNELFEIQKRVALMIHEELNVELTPAERERLGVHRTQNIEALLAYGLGLEAWDAARFADAAAHFDRAAQLDPSFTLAAQHASRAREMGEPVPSPADLALLGAVELPELDIVAFDPLLAAQAAIVPDGPQRNHAQEAFGTEGFSFSRSILNLIIRRPQ